MEVFGGFGLVPSAFFQHVDDDAAFALFHDLEERGVGAGLVERGELVESADEVIGQQVER